MNKKQAFREAVGCNPVFPVPYVIRFTVEAEERYRNYKGGIFDPVMDTGTYAVFSQTNSGWEEVRPGFFKDYFGVVWNKTLDKTLGIVEDSPIKSPSLQGFTFPGTDNLPVYGFQEINNRDYPGHFHILSIGFTLFERAWSLVGMENLLTWMLMEPAFVHDLFDRIAEYNIGLIRYAAEIGGIDCVRFGDDWAGQHGLLFGRELWLEFIKPRLKAMADASGREGLIPAQHCCGKVNELIPEMIDSGIRLFDPFQPEVMNVDEVFTQYHNKIAFMGGLSIQQTMPSGMPKDVIHESSHLLSGLGEKGGYIFSPSHALTRDIPPKNIDTMLNLVMHQDQFIHHEYGKGDSF